MNNLQRETITKKTQNLAIAVISGNKCRSTNGIYINYYQNISRYSSICRLYYYPLLYSSIIFTIIFIHLPSVTIVPCEQGVEYAHHFPAPSHEATKRVSRWQRVYSQLNSNFENDNFELKKNILKCFFDCSESKVSGFPKIFQIFNFQT